MSNTTDSDSKILNIIIAILIIADLFLLTWSDFSSTNLIITKYVIYFDLMVCFVLFCDFIYRFNKSNDKKAFMKDYRTWLDIIAMIPLEFTPLRILRLVRVIILLSKFSKQIKKFIEETHLDWSIGVLLITIISGTILFYIVEIGINSNIHNLGDALWYIIPTMGTDGGNIFPQTIPGRIISITVMFVGILFLGMFTATIASWLTKKSGNKCEQDEIKELKELVQELNTKIIKLSEEVKKSK